MSDADRTCRNCGALPKSRDARFCEFCGTELPEVVEKPPAAAANDLYAALEALTSHPDYPRLMRLRPSAGGYGVGMGVGIVAGLFFTGVSVALFIGFQMGAPAPMSYFPLLFVAIGVLILVLSIRRAVKFSSAPLGRNPAVVVGKRTQVSGGGQNSSASTTYYVTLENQHGHREEYIVLGRLAGRIREYDVGVAYTKDNALLDFRRVRT